MDKLTVMQKKIILIGLGLSDERRGVARGEVVGVDVDDVLHDDAVHDPQRLRTAVN